MVAVTMVAANATRAASRALEVFAATVRKPATPTPIATALGTTALLRRALTHGPLLVAYLAELLAAARCRRG